MPVFSYIAYPVQGKKNKLLQDLERMQYCHAVPADNDELIILVTDTPNDEKEKKLTDRLKEIKSLSSLSMTFGYLDEQTVEG